MASMNVASGMAKLTTAPHAPHPLKDTQKAAEPCDFRELKG
jgi:hypothetical protein